MMQSDDERSLGRRASELRKRDFARLADFVQGYSGIMMPPIKKTLMEGRLRRRAKALGMSDVSEYCRYLLDEGGLDEEAEHVIDVVTTNKTDFFREAAHFEFLSCQALPNLLCERNSPQIKAWSAACSIGAEAYSIAMVLGDFALVHREMTFTVYATDICHEVLQRGVRAVYSDGDVVPVPRSQRDRYFMRAKNPDRGEVRVVPSLRQQVRFGRLNLMDPCYAMPKDMDIIFCRNVLIYFRREVQHQVLSRLCEHLRPGGYLFVGHTESLAGHRLPVNQVGNAVFVRNQG